MKTKFQKNGILLTLFAILCIGNIYAQKTVQGIVSDEQGVPLIGVNILEEGTTNGTVTDFDGKFSLEVQENSNLIFSYVGYGSQTISTQGDTDFSITLRQGTSLDEVVVTALGIKKDVKALGYSVAKVDEDRILASGTPSNALQSLYGTASGVQVASTATGPAGGMKINIRNAVSFDQNSTTRPLIVVDGIPIHDERTGITANARSGRDNGTGINDINPDDIESIDILKGAKASVLYGSEGANGVVLITTKSGSKNSGLGVSASFTTTFDKAAFLPKLQNQYGTGRSPSNTSTDNQGFFLDENGDRALDISGGAFGPKFDPSVQLKWWDGSTRPWVANSESIYDQLFETGHQNVANIALTSGGENGSMRFSYTNSQINTIYPNGEYNRHSFSISANYALNDFINLKYSGNYFITENLNPSYEGSFDSQGSTSSLGAYSADIDVDLIRSQLVTPGGYNYFSNPENTQNRISAGRSALANTLWDWTQDEFLFDRNHNIQSLTLDMTFSDNLGLTILGGFDNTKERSEYKGKLRDPSLIGPNSGSVYRDNARNLSQLYGQGLLNFEANLSNRIELSAFGGGAIRKNYLESKGATQIGGFVIPNFFSFSNLPSGVQPIYDFDNGEDILYSILGSVQLAYDNQIYLEAQARQDWSSILPPSNNRYFYPGLSATWIISNAFDLPKEVQFLKLRTSWADVGRPGPRYFSNVNLGVSASGSGFILSPPNDLPPIDDDFIPNLRPERKREFEVGLEGFFFENQRLGFDFSVYHSNTYDQIMGVTAPPGYGVNNIRINAGNVANTGWELGLKTKPVIGPKVNWNIDFTISGAKTQVLELDGDLSSLQLWSRNGLNAIAEVGGEYGQIYQNSGISHYINPSDPNDPSNGKLIVANSGARYEYTSATAKKVGKILPDFFGGVFSNLTIGNFKLIANLDYSFGAFFISEAETYMMASGVLEESLKYRDEENGGIAYYLNNDGAKVRGTNPNGGATFYDGVILDGVRANGEENQMVVSAEEYYSASYFSNGFFPEDRLFKSDYIALRNIALDYRLPSKLTAPVGLNSVVFSVFANNVAYLYKDAPNTIPESSNGSDWSSANFGTTALPALRSIGLSVKIKL